jgi:hypothetical protein
LRWVQEGLLPPEAVAQIILRLIENSAFPAADGTVDRDAVKMVIQHCLERLGPDKSSAQACSAVPHLNALARVLTRRLGEWCLEPDWLAITIKSWAQVGALPLEARQVGEDVLRHLLPGPFFTRLRDVLREGDAAMCAAFLRELKEGGRLGLRVVARRRCDAWLKAGAAPEGGDDPETNFEFLLRGDFLAGEGLAETACRYLNALQAMIDDKDFNEAMARRRAAVGAFVEEDRGAVDREALVLEALVLETLTHRDLGQQATGLALSGGGLRSASFNLGLLQALHRGSRPSNKGMWDFDALQFERIFTEFVNAAVDRPQSGAPAQEHLPGTYRTHGPHWSAAVPGQVEPIKEPGSRN